MDDLNTKIPVADASSNDFQDKIIHPLQEYCERLVKPIVPFMKNTHQTAFIIIDCTIFSLLILIVLVLTRES